LQLQSSNPSTRLKAWAFVRNDSTALAQSTKRPLTVAATKSTDESDKPPAKRAKKIDAIIKPAYTVPDNTLLCYTDGAASKNGMAGANAGIGVYFPAHEDWNISEPLSTDIKTDQTTRKGSKANQTNQTAELEAIYRALKAAKKSSYKSLIIRTDSQYSIDCLTKWFQNWQQRDWKGANGKPVVHRVQVQKCLKILAVLKVKFEKVKGHSGDYGNDRADALAVAGAEKQMVGKKLY